MTIEKCKAHCFEDYLYAGVYWADECYCGNVEPSDKRSASECYSPCAGNSAQICGGGSKYMNVYYNQGKTCDFVMSSFYYELNESTYNVSTSE